MADTVDTKVIQNGQRYYVVRLTNQSDGTGESAVAKVDISGLTVNGQTVTYTAIDRIDYAVNGSGYVLLAWDHTTDDEIAVLSGNGCIDVSHEGGMVDPKSSGGTGDILLTTDGFADGSSYDITLRIRKKA